jgi:hypothetical protein
MLRKMVVGDYAVFAWHQTCSSTWAKVVVAIDPYGIVTLADTEPGGHALTRLIWPGYVGRMTFAGFVWGLTCVQ